MRSRCHEGPSRRGHNLTIPLDLTISLEKYALAAHGHEVSAIAARIADELDLSTEAIGHLRLAGLLHDIGKLWIPDHILEKQGPLTVAEWAEVRKHPENGALMLRADGLDQEADWVLCHHERPDGLGYPYGLSGDEIPLESPYSGSPTRGRRCAPTAPTARRSPERPPAPSSNTRGASSSMPCSSTCFSTSSSPNWGQCQAGSGLQALTCLCNLTIQGIAQP